MIRKKTEQELYKERWINEDGLEQRLIVTYSLKYRIYQEQIRNRQVERAEINWYRSSKNSRKANQNDYKRFIEQIPYTLMVRKQKRLLSP